MAEVLDSYFLKRKLGFKRIIGSNLATLFTQASGFQCRGHESVQLDMEHNVHELM